VHDVRWRKPGVAVSAESVADILSTHGASMAPKYRHDLILACAWELEASASPSLSLPSELTRSLSAWDLIELVRKTQGAFQVVLGSSFEEVVQGARFDTCPRCHRRVCDLLLGDEQIGTQDEARACLYRWRHRMRAVRPEVAALTWPRFDTTLMMLKPGVSAAVREKALSHLSGAQPRPSERRTMSGRDVLRIYSTAYGKGFRRRMEQYYCSGETEIFELTSPDIVNRQVELKQELRRNLGVNGQMMQNVLHLPDTLGETYDHLAYFLGADRLRERLRSVCWGP
jgi:hypothetical protein